MAIAFGHVTERQPIPIVRVQELVQPFTNASTGQCYFGPSGIDDGDGMPWVVIVTQDATRPRRYRERGHMGLIAWRWNLTPSCPFSLTVMGLKDPRPQSRWFAASEAPVVQAILRVGRLNVCLAHPSGTRSGWFEATFESADRRPSTEALSRMWTFPVPGIPESQLGKRYRPFDKEVPDEAEQIPLWTDFVGDAWATLAGKGPWTDDLDVADQKVTTWATCYRHKRARAAGFIQMIMERQTFDNVASLLDPHGRWVADHGDAMKLNEVLERHASIRKWIAALAGPSPDAHTAHEAAYETLHTPAAIFAFVAEFMGSVNGTADPEFAEALQFSCWAALLDPRITALGRKRPWLKNLGHSQLELRTILLDTSCPASDLDTLWRAGLQFCDLLDAGEWFTPTDLPAPLDKVNKTLEAVRLEGPLHEAYERIKQLLNEAQEARQWSIPWGARIQIEFGPFVALRVFEVEGEFSCHFLDEQDRYLNIAVGLGRGRPTISSVELIREPEKPGELIWNEEAVISLQLIAAAIVRDFLVVEERDRTFSSRPMRKRIAGRNINTIIYLPRVRYSRGMHGLAEVTESEERNKARHSVSHHLRKAGTASAAQRFLAQRFGIALPTGFTFVRPHERGGTAPDERVRIYRSRSASRMLFEQVAVAPLGARPAWFEFEKACMRLLEGDGMRVVHQAVHKDGDGGVDLFAVDTDGKSWIVQCKCWALHRAVGPDVVRELVGAIELADRGSDYSSRGMIITTTRLTSGASADAAKLGIRVVDSLEFARLAQR
jgi:hypothetical protein